MKSITAILVALVAALAMAAPASASPTNDPCEENPEASWCAGPSEADCPDGFEYTGDPEYPCHDTASGPDPEPVALHASIIEYCWPEEGGNYYLDLAVTPGGAYTFWHESSDTFEEWDAYIPENGAKLVAYMLDLGAPHPAPSRVVVTGRMGDAPSETLLDAVLEPCDAAYAEGDSGQGGQDAPRPSVTGADAAPVVPVAAADTLPETGAGVPALATLAAALLAAGGVVLRRVRA